jgi:hypothetical protein
MYGQMLAAWKLPLIVAAIAITIVGSFYLGGPGLGMAIGALNAGAILLIAVRNPPLNPITPARRRDRRDHLLVVVEEPLEDGEAIERIAAQPEAEVRVVAPTRMRFLDRWASDTRPSREQAERNLVLTLASLARAGIDATARIGDEDVVQTVTDQLRDYPATEVMLVTAPAGADAEEAVGELRARLRAPFHHLRCRPAALAHSAGPPPCER